MPEHALSTAFSSVELNSGRAGAERICSDGQLISARDSETSYLGSAATDRGAAQIVLLLQAAPAIWSSGCFQSSGPWSTQNLRFARGRLHPPGPVCGAFGVWGRRVPKEDCDSVSRCEHSGCESGWSRPRHACLRHRTIGRPEAQPLPAQDDSHSSGESANRLNHLHDRHAIRGRERDEAGCPAPPLSPEL